MPSSLWRWLGANNTAVTATTSSLSVPMSGWASPTIATTASGQTWVTYVTDATGDALYWVATAQQQYAAQRAQQLWQQGLAQQTLLQQQMLVTPSIARPAIITHQENARRDRELYRRAVEMCDAQAARLLRVVERHELLAADERRAMEEQRQRRDEERQRREAASARARELLLEHLTPLQRETFDANGWFIVEGGRTGTQYRVRAVESMVANVDVLNQKSGRPTHRLCAHARVGSVPLGDQLLAQKIMLELAEDDFLRTANRHAA
jgi:hypothetical protein